MTQPTALAESSSATATSPPFAGGFVMNLIVTLLAPLFLCVTAGDIGLAHIAAAETLEEYRIRTQLDPIAVGQIVLNGLASLDSLSRSLVDDLSLTMVLRLRGNGIALNRAAEQNRRGRRQEETVSFLVASRMDLGSPAPVVDRVRDAETVQAEPMVSRPAEDLPIAHPAELPADPAPVDDATPTVSQTPQPRATDEKRQRRVRVMAMVNEAADLKASLRILPETEHEAVEIRIAVLDSMVHAMLTGSAPAGQADGAAYASG